MRHTCSVDDITVLIFQSSKQGECHGYCRAPPQPAGLSLLAKAVCGGQIGKYVPISCPSARLYSVPRNFKVIRYSSTLHKSSHTPPLDAQIFWSQQSKQEEDSLHWYRAPSVDVELTSSILMAHISKSSLSSDEIRKASQIVSWLIKQQNPYGGFASTQVIPWGHWQ